MNRPIHTRLLDQSEFSALAQPLRHAVFVLEQGIDQAIESDGSDQDCRHYGLWYEDEFAATARIAATGKLGRMAVATHLRRNGLGAALVRHIIAQEIRRGTQSIHLHAQASAIAFYHALGFVDQGDRFFEAGIEHQAMIMNLTT